MQFYDREDEFWNIQIDYADVFPQTLFLPPSGIFDDVCDYFMESSYNSYVDFIVVNELSITIQKPPLADDSDYRITIYLKLYLHPDLYDYK